MPLDETVPISDDEILLRRIPPDQWNDGCEPISPQAFKPRVNGRDPDEDGISLFRLDCLDHPSQLLTRIPDEQKRSKSGIAGIQVLSVRQVKTISLSVMAKPEPPVQGRLPGHVVIPEINATAYLDKSRKGSVTAAMSELAEFASAKVFIRHGNLDLHDRQ
jgi:hypothetical protein